MATKLVKRTKSSWSYKKVKAKQGKVPKPKPVKKRK